MLHAYARIVGTGLALWAIAGLFGVWGQSPLRSVLFLGTALIFLYAGFGRVDTMELRTIVGGMGILYLLSTAFLLVVWAWFNTSDNPETAKILLRGTIGIVSLLCAKFLPQRDEEVDYRSSEVQPYTTQEIAPPQAQGLGQSHFLKKTITRMVMKAAAKRRTTTSRPITSGPKTVSRKK